MGKTIKIGNSEPGTTVGDVLPDPKVLGQMKQMVGANKPEAQNSFVFRRGGPNTEVKIYYIDMEDLIKQLSEWQANAEHIADAVGAIKGKFLTE